MWELNQASGANVCLRNPSSAARYEVVVKSEMIRNGEHMEKFPIIYGGAQEELDTFDALGVDTRFDISWHEQADGSDDQRHWSTKLG